MVRIASNVCLDQQAVFISLVLESVIYVLHFSERFEKQEGLFWSNVFWIFFFFLEEKPINLSFAS